MQVIVWSKDGCGYCVMAKNLLKLKGIDFEERNITSSNWTKKDLLEMAPSARTLPQIFFGDECVGGYTELKERLG
jgi:glutaredoxin 3